MPGDAPKFAISQITTLTSSFEDDLRAYAAAGAEAIGIWEFKLPEGGDAQAAEALEASGLGAGAAVPAVPSILPLPLEGPAEPAERIDAICRSIERLARFRPSAIVCLTGAGTGRTGDDARSIVVEGLRTLGDEAARHGSKIALEPYQREDGSDWTIVSTLRDAASLIEDAGNPAAVGLVFDVWHLWNDEGVYEDVRRFADMLAAVHVCDYREPTRSFADRVLPGDGVADVAALLGALDEAGWGGYYELEIFSDNGTFGNAYEESLWNLPADELAGRGREKFFACWEARP